MFPPFILVRMNKQTPNSHWTPTASVLISRFPHCSVKSLGILYRFIWSATHWEALGDKWEKGQYLKKFREPCAYSVLYKHSTREGEVVWYNLSHKFTCVKPMLIKSILVHYLNTNPINNSIKLPLQFIILPVCTSLYSLSTSAAFPEKEGEQGHSIAFMFHAVPLVYWRAVLI